MNNNLLFVLSCILVFVILISVNFDSIYTYTTITNPLQNAVQDTQYVGEYHYVLLENSHELQLGTVNSIKQIDEDTIEILFTDNDLKITDGREILYQVPIFEHTETIKQNQSFVEMCADFKRDSEVGIGILKYLGIVEIEGESYYKFFRTNAYVSEPFECNFPSIIDESVLIDWILYIPDEKNAMEHFY